MNIQDFREYLLKNMAILQPDTADLAKRVIDLFDKTKLNAHQEAGIKRILRLLSGVLILKFERKTEEKLTVALKKLITLF